MPLARLLAYHYIPVILAIRSERAAVTGRISRVAYLSSMTNKVDVHRMTPFWRNQRQQRLVRIVGILAGAKQAKPFRDAKHMRINRKCRFAEGE